ncbi:hypothetical protein VC188_08865 [Polynucleobacter sp. MG-28-Ekke-A2]|uniref:hypothetical protein n=1 Tax=Polynucleobacter sp. MG-28-Ekke-A2 TaxID=3108276 RepID=UPI002B231FE9|nr:hypothetical protein [Polynucleobacter sp. MG-28-Ekke-A2]MEA9602229.1 hypothetical protein [Polynucleobacter sp. MG-28-Ekke-A2]
MNLKNDPNIANIEHIAQALGELRNSVVLVGGAVVGILITDTNRPAARPTLDVDLVTKVSGRAEYYRVCEVLRKAGFKENDQVICRWTKDGVLVDLMPTDPTILGFSNRWHELAMQTSIPMTLPSGLVLRHISAPLFIASKLESFHDRGKGDYAHHDIEDIINLVDGKSDLNSELAQASAEVQLFIREEIEDLLLDPDFMAQIPWHLNPTATEQDRSAIIIERLRTLAGL